MKTNNKDKKNIGSYYTPPTLSDFIVYNLFGNEGKYQFNNHISILEPSAGDGVFFHSLFNNKNFKDKIHLPEKINLYAVEREKQALELLKGNTGKYFSTKKYKISHFNQDYLEYNALNKKRKYDLVIGNPPYIKGQHLTKEQLEFCDAMHKEVGLGKKTIKNIWTSFLIGGVESLNDQGILCFVLPAELLQVIYAKELRNYLKDKFQFIEIFTFNELVFGIEQDVIILFCSKLGSKGMSFYHVDKLEELKVPTYTKDNSNIHRETLDKWTNYILEDKELKLLDKLKEKLFPVRNYCRAEVGIVTAANNYFIVSKSVVSDKSLQEITKPILQKGMYMPSSVFFTKTDFKKIVTNNKPSQFLAFENIKSSNFSSSLKSYLKEGEQLNIHERYKCRLRNNWYFVPSVWISEGFFTKRSDVFPRTIVNNAKVIVTDSFYRIRMREGLLINDLVFSFYNTLTFVLAELEGRYYGGSVLELTPNEYKNLSIPYCNKISNIHLNKLDDMLRSGVNILKILDYTDKIVLKNYYNFKDSDILKLRNMYKKLVKRRLKKRDI